MPVEAWLASLDAWLARSPHFFASKPIVLQLSTLEIDLREYRALLNQLARRHIRVMAVENSPKLLVGPHLPPIISGGLTVSPEKILDENKNAPDTPKAAPAAHRNETLFHDGHLRSGQQIVHLGGDVVVIGRVASGAEVVAGGSIHVYGSLQGRAFAGVADRPEARILCRSARAELLCIGGAFVTAEETDGSFEDKPIEARLEEGRVKIRAII